jgi:hypothetical protein
MSYGFFGARSALLHAAMWAGMLAGALLPVTPVAAEDLIVQYDQARLLRLPEPAASIIIGNPSIAEISMHSPELLIVTGKTFGVTNLIVMDNAGRVILSERLMVKGDDQKVVSVVKGTLTQTYNCLPQCQPILKVGDEDNYYQTIARSAESKMKISESSDTSQVAN